MREMHLSSILQIDLENSCPKRSLCAIGFIKNKWGT